MVILEKLLWILSPEGIQQIIQAGGLPIICLIIFAETGFFALLPGDSMLVLCGMFAATKGANGEPLLPLPWLMALVPIFGILGDQVGFWLGTFVGKPIYKWKDIYLWKIPLFKQAYLRKTESFYARWGSFTIVAGRWVPFVRTFAPIVAGLIHMRFVTFIAFNIIGAFSWVWSMLLAGYLLPPIIEPVIQKVWPGFTLAEHIDKIAIGIVFVSLLPILHTLWKERQETQKAQSSCAEK